MSAILSYDQQDRNLVWFLPDIRSALNTAWLRSSVGLSNISKDSVLTTIHHPRALKFNNVAPKKSGLPFTTLIY